MRRFLLLLLLLSLRPASAESTFAGRVIDVCREGAGVHCVLENGRLRVRVLAANLVRVRFTPRDKFDDRPSHAVVERTWAAPPGFEYEDTDDHVWLGTSELSVTITKRPCRVRIADRQGRVLSEDDPSYGMGVDGREVRCYKTLQKGEQFYGLGEKTGWLDRRGREWVNWNSDIPGYSPNQDPLYVSIPFYMGVHGGRCYGIFLDNPWKSMFSFGAGTDRFASFGAVDGDLDYFFIGGPDPERVLSTYAELTGRAPMPPRWALGYQQSRWSYTPDWRVREVASGFRRRGIPCDVIYLDIDYMDGYRVFTWDKDRFPDPRGLIADLAAQGFKVVPIIDPGVKADPQYRVAREGLERGLFATWPDGTPYQGEVWPSWSYFPDFTSAEARAWWGDQLQGMLDLGVQGFWNDMNEPAVWGKTPPDIVRFKDGDHRRVHNVFALEMARATFEALSKYSDRRHLVLTRAGFSGTQRYAAVWTGDNVSNEAHLRMACTMPQSMGLSGLPFVGSDVGGFDGAPSGPLFVRWMQLGAFTPFFRGHSQKGEPDKEPWALGEEVAEMVKDAISLRYRMLPYWYTLFHEASVSGVPPMRPMLLEFPSDETCWTRDAQLQFMLGDALLVAPVVSEHDRAKKVYLPRGRWLDWWTSEVVSGPGFVTVDAPLGRIPLFLREGGVVPMRDVQPYADAAPAKEMELRVFLPASGSSVFELYDDDGVTFGYRDGKYRTTRVSTSPAGVSMEVTHDGYDGGTRTWVLRMASARKPRGVTVNGAAAGFEWRDGAVVVRVPTGRKVDVRVL